jgi:hypothetical protein
MIALDPDCLPPHDPAAWRPAKPTRKASAAAPPTATSNGIAGAIGDWREHDGRKHQICGAVGGLMRALNYSRAACEAEIRAWLPVGEPSVDVAAGVAWACGAWDKPALEASGMGAVRDALGDELAERVFAAAMAPIEARQAERRAARATPDETAWASSVTESMPNSQPAFVLTERGEEMWVYDPRIEAYRPFGPRSLHSILAASGMTSMVETRGAKGLLPVQAIIDTGPTDEAKAVHVAFYKPAGGTFDAPSHTMLLGLAGPSAEPAYDAEVDAWLNLLCGKSRPAVDVFIASCAQRYMHRPAVALVVIGPNSIGKSLLAKALAKMWGATHPVPLKAVVAQFNASMCRCPIVNDDECVALKARLVSTDMFRELVQDDARDVEPKGLEKRTLLGCQRFLMSGNDATDLVFTDAGGPGAIDALARRLLYVDATEVDQAALEEALARLFVSGDPGRVDLARLVGHFAWIQERTPVGGERFIGSDLADTQAATKALTRGTVEGNSALFARIKDVLDGGQTTKGARVGGDGVLLVDVRAMTELLNTSHPSDRWSESRVTAALTPFGVGGKGRDEVACDTFRICHAVGADPVALFERLAAQA